MAADDATTLVAQVRANSAGAAAALFELVYADLRRKAEALLRGERLDHTLQATALVNEAYIRLIRQDGAAWQDRAHFCAIAARAMRQVLVDHARGRNRDKRGGNRDRRPLDSALFELEASAGDVDIEALDAALERLASIAPRSAEIVQMRFFAGLTAEEVAEVLQISLSTAEREWRFARAWLHERLGGGGSD